MSDPNETEATPAVDEVTKKAPIISLPFIIIVGVLAVGGYFAGPWVMKMVMYQQEKYKAANFVAPDDPEGEPESYGDGSSPEGQGGGGRGGRGGGGGRGGFDPEAIFAERDADGNGKIEGDEIQGRMADRMDSIDTDGDGAASKEEFLAAMQNFRGGRGGGRGGGRPEGAGDRASGRPAGANESDSTTESGENGDSDTSDSGQDEQTDESETSSSSEEQNSSAGAESEDEEQP